MIKRVCAWCQKDLGTIESDKEGTTHGICPDCLAELEKKVKDKKYIPDEFDKDYARKNYRDIQQQAREEMGIKRWG